MLRGRMPVSRRAGALKLGYWQRSLPMMLVLVLGLVAVVYSYGPSLFFRTLYPLKYEDAISEAAGRYGVDPYLVAATVRVESNWDPDAESAQGAQGLMQVMPETARDMVAKGLVNPALFSPDNLYDPVTNIEFGCAYLSYLIGYFNGVTDRAIAAYNGGMGNVAQWAQDMEGSSTLHNAIKFPETQAYLVRVNNATKRYQELYPEAFL